MQEILSTILKDTLITIYESFWASLIISILVMFFIMFAYSDGNEKRCGIKATLTFGLNKLKTSSSYRSHKSLEKNITEIEYLKKLLEDVVYFNAPVIVCDIEGRIDEWKRRKAEEEAAEIPVWHNKSAEEFKYFKRMGKAFLLGTGTKPKSESEKDEDCMQDGNRKK